VVYTIKHGRAWLYHLNSWSNPRTYMMILSGIVQARCPQELSEERAPISAPTSIGFLRISLNLGPKISHVLLGIIDNRQFPTGVDFVFFCEHPISRFWSKTGLKSRKIKRFRTIFLHDSTAGGEKRCNTKSRGRRLPYMSAVDGLNISIANSC
jgi:hypothetical protein